MKVRAQFAAASLPTAASIAFSGELDQQIGHIIFPVARIQSALIDSNPHQRAQAMR